MTVLTITIPDEQAESIKKILADANVTDVVEQEKKTTTVSEPLSALERIKKIQQSIGDKKLFEAIKDPSEWQREIRKEWDRDF